jgi:TM2 domain-containing membrane protein YozV
MKCAVHPDAEAVGYCRNCGKAMCALCVRPVRDVLYCEDCLANLMGVPASRPASAPPALAPADASPPAFAADFAPPPAPLATAPPQPLATRGAANAGLAFVLGFLFPGLGAVYNGQYNKALLQIIIFVAMIVGLSSDASDGFKAALGILLAGFIFYMAFDSMRVARERASGAVITADPLDNWSKDRPVGPILLIVIGVILLLNQFDWFPWYRIGQFWPIILIVIGVILFRNRLAGRQ